MHGLARREGCAVQADGRGLVLVQLCWQQVQQLVQLLCASLQAVCQGLQLVNQAGSGRIRGREQSTSTTARGAGDTQQQAAAAVQSVALARLPRESCLSAAHTTLCKHAAFIVQHSAAKACLLTEHPPALERPLQPCRRRWVPAARCCRCCIRLLLLLAGQQQRALSRCHQCAQVAVTCLHVAEALSLVERLQCSSTPAEHTHHTHMHAQPDTFM